MLKWTVAYRYAYNCISRPWVLIGLNGENGAFKTKDDAQHAADLCNEAEALRAQNKKSVSIKDAMIEATYEGVKL